MSSTLQKYMVLSMGYDDLVGIVGGGGLERIKRELKEFNLYAILETCAKISITLLNNGIVSPLGQAKLLNGIFPDKKQRLMFYEKARAKAAGTPWAIFNHQSVLTLVKLAFSCCRYESGKSLTGEEVEKLGYWLLILNDECYAEETRLRLPTPDLERERLRKALARYQFFHASERLAYKVGRYRWLVEYLKSMEPHGFSLEQYFKEASGGIELSDYLNVCLSLMVKWVNLSTKEEVNLGEVWVTCTEVYFRETKLELPTINKILDMLAMLPQEYALLHEESVKKVLGGVERLHYNFMPFFWRPLIWYQDKKCFICPSTEYLFDKATEGIYRTIETYLWNQGRLKERQTLAIAWGEAIEEYVNSCFSDAFSSAYHKNLTHGKLQLDGLLDSPGFIFMIETKSLHWPYERMVVGDLEKADTQMEQLFTKKGLNQLSKFIEACKDGTWKPPIDVKSKNIIPVVVVSEAMPQDPYNRRFYEQVAQGSALHEGSLTLPFIIVTVEEVEIIEAIAKAKGTEVATQILAEYAHVYRNRNEIGIALEAISLKNYLYHRGYEDPDKATNNVRVMRYFDKAMDEVCLSAFGKHLKKKVPRTAN